LIEGRAAKGQLSVFGSEPGEPDYNPLWEEKFVTWKAATAGRTSSGSPSCRSPGRASRST